MSHEDNRNGRTGVVRRGDHAGGEDHTLSLLVLPTKGNMSPKFGAPRLPFRITVRSRRLWNPKTGTQNLGLETLTGRWML